MVGRFCVRQYRAKTSADRVELTRERLSRNALQSSTYPIMLPKWGTLLTSACSARVTGASWVAELRYPGRLTRKSGRHENIALTLLGQAERTVSSNHSLAVEHLSAQRKSSGWTYTGPEEGSWIYMSKPSACLIF